MTTDVVQIFPRHSKRYFILILIWLTQNWCSLEYFIPWFKLRCFLFLLYEANVFILEFLSHAVFGFDKSKRIVLFSVQFSHSVVSDSLRPHEPQHARPLCPSPTPGVHPNPCPLSWWCHPTISSSVVPFSSCPQSFPESGCFQMSQLFTSGGQSIGSFSFNISPSNEHPGLISLRMDWLDLLAVQGTQESSPTPQFKSINSLALSFLYTPTLTSIHDHWKNHSLD